MKAIVQERYGSPDVLRFEDRETPVPKGDEVLVRIKATALNAADWRILRADPSLVRLSLGFRRPKSPIPGSDIAGVVEAVGPEARRCRPGDSVFGIMPFKLRGGCAEFIAVSETLLASLPDALNHKTGASLPMAGLTALQALRDFALAGPGKKVLVYGASGGVGTFAVQLAVVLGAEVTAVCSGPKKDQALALGASRALDYASEDFAEEPHRYDAIIATNGHRKVADFTGVLNKGGRLVLVGGSDAGQLVSAMVLAPLISLLSGRKILSMVGKDSLEDLTLLARWTESGRLSPVIDREYPLERTAEAFRYLEEGHAKGKVLVTPAPA